MAYAIWTVLRYIKNCCRSSRIVVVIFRVDVGHCQSLVIDHLIFGRLLLVVMYMWNHSHHNLGWHQWSLTSPCLRTPRHSQGSGLWPEKVLTEILTIMMFLPQPLGHHAPHRWHTLGWSLISLPLSLLFCFSSSFAWWIQPVQEQQVARRELLRLCSARELPFLAEMHCPLLFWRNR